MPTTAKEEKMLTSSPEQTKPIQHPIRENKPIDRIRSKNILKVSWIGDSNTNNRKINMEIDKNKTKE